MEQKTCPLMMIAGKINQNCKGDECAWWNHCSCECAVLATAAAIDALSSQFIDIDEPIPYTVNKIPE